MAGALQAVSLAAPGFYGLNTQESGITISSGFALEAQNCIIDKFGRIGSRKGWTKLSGTSASVTGAVRAIAEYVKTDGALEILFTANNKLWKFTDSATTPVELTANDTTAITITDDDWQIITFNNKAVFETPKPVGLLKVLLQLALPNGIVLDFFSGSGTTAQAVMELNSEDGGI